jgi:hypothetical protein
MVCRERSDGESVVRGKLPQMLPICRPGFSLTAFSLA